MKRKYSIIALICLTFIGAFVAALASGMFFADVANKDVPFKDTTIFTTIPACAFALLFVIGILYVVRINKHPDCFKRISRLYLILAIAFSVVGLVGNILSAALNYHSFVSKNPFPGFHIIFLVLELASIGGAVFGLLKLRDVKEGEGKVEIKVSYVFKTIGWSLFICLMLNRLSSFVTMPFYVYARNLYKTFPFYLFLLVPLFLGVVEVLYVFKMVDRKKMLIMTCSGIGAAAILFVYSVLMGINDTGFISSLSEAMPLERLASMPMEIMIHFVSYLGVGAALLVQALKMKKE